ncbi:MAG: sugar phosphate isomerase/epimerase [Ruminococcaceae bacterium]|nr:sugar phosphate isomerase/epimerase [Oscillospiraceae bacterium]
MKFSVSSYSFAQYINAGKMTQLDCVAKAKEMGFDAIEFIDLKGETKEEKTELARAIKAEAEKVGIEINAYTIGANLFADTAEAREAEIQKVKDQLDIAAVLGVKLLRHDVCWNLAKAGKGRSFDLMLPDLADSARKITEYAQSLGIRTCSENHGMLAQDSDRMERLFNAVNHDNYGLLIDMGNFLCVDENPAVAVSRLAPYAFHVHAKDMAVREKPLPGHTLVSRGCNYLKCCALGEGDVPIEKCIRILLKAGYEGFLSIEYEGAEDCIQGIEKGLKHLKEIFARI